jgi:hypothetical protein
LNSKITQQVSFNWFYLEHEFNLIFQQGRMQQEEQYVYTVERDRNLSAFYPPPYQEKDELPTYEESLNHTPVTDPHTRSTETPQRPQQNSNIATQ